MVDINSKRNFAPELSFSDILRTIWRRKWILVVFLAISVGGAYMYLQRVKPLFKATAYMRLIQRTPAMAGSLESMYAAPLQETTETQVEIIRSPNMWVKTDQFLR